MTNISFIIPCGRIPFENNGKLTVDSILLHHNNPEIIVSSKEEINYKNIIFLKEDENNYGTVKPINNMANIASRDFISVLNDDFYIKDNLESIIRFINTINLVGLTLMLIDWLRTGYSNIPYNNPSDNLRGPNERHTTLNIPNMPFPLNYQIVKL